jgi:hypothetical protein
VKELRKERIPKLSSFKGQNKLSTQSPSLWSPALALKCTPMVPGVSSLSRQGASCLAVVLGHSQCYLISMMDFPQEARGQIHSQGPLSTAGFEDPSCL